MKTGDLCAYAPKSSIKAGEAVSNGKYMFFTSSSDENKRYSDYQFDCEAIIMGTGGNATLHYYNGKFSTSTDCVVLIPNKAIRCKYLYYFFLCNMVTLENGFKGAGLKHTNKNYISNIEIYNVPDIETQDKIIKILDVVCGIKLYYRQQLQKLDELVKSRFIELFGDPELNPRDLPVLPWSAVFQTTTGKLDSNAMVENGRYPFFTCAKESYKIDSYAFDCEALLLAGNNAAGIYDVKHYKGKFNAYQRTYVLRLMNEKWNYILFKRQLEDKLRYLQSQSKGTNTRYLTLGILNELRFVVPPIAEQKQFATVVEQVDKLKFEVKLALEKLETLKKSLMQQYFG